MDLLIKLSQPLLQLLHSSQKIRKLGLLCKAFLGPGNVFPGRFPIDPSEIQAAKRIMVLIRKYIIAYFQQHLFKLRQIHFTPEVTAEPLVGQGQIPGPLDPQTLAIVLLWIAAVISRLTILERWAAVGVWFAAALVTAFLLSWAQPQEQEDKALTQ